MDDRVPARPERGQGVPSRAALRGHGPGGQEVVQAADAEHAPRYDAGLGRLRGVLDREVGDPGPVGAQVAVGKGAQRRIRRYFSADPA